MQNNRIMRLFALLMALALMVPAFAVAEGLQTEENDVVFSQPVEDAVAEAEEFLVGKTDPQAEEGVELVGEGKGLADANALESNATWYYKDYLWFLYSYQGSETSVTIPSNFTYIDYWAFYEKDNLQEVTMTSIEEIDGEAFYYCSNLKRVNMSSSVVYIASNAFVGCHPNLVITAPEGSYAAWWASAHGYSADVSSVKLNKSKATLGVGQTLKLKATVSPSGASTTLKWSSSNKAVAKVSSSGKVTAKKKGTATITVKTANGKKAKAKITVKAAPKKVKLNKSGTVKLKAGKTLQLKATFSPSSAKASVTWESSKPSVAKVSSSGKVTAKKKGTATITATTHNGKTAKVKIKVTGSASTSSVKYRALLIGEEYFTWESGLCTRNRGDVGLMKTMLNSVKGPEGGSYSITCKYDRSASQIKSDIKSAFGDADSNDVSLFFIATHGDASTTGYGAGALAVSPNGSLLLDDLASALQAVPGKVIVILESCGSGAAVFETYAEQNDAAANAIANAKAFDQAVIDAFAAADTGIVTNDVENTGEFRVENKFYVLCASRYLESSWGTEYYKYNYFTKWLTDGIGTSGTMKADKDGDKNGTTSLKELFKYISKVGDNYAFRTTSGSYYQHVQAYPKSSTYGLFSR